MVYNGDYTVGYTKDGTWRDGGRERITTTTTTTS